MKTILLMVVLLVGVCQIAPAQEPLTRDELRAAVQKICPVSGTSLGEHGDPIKVKFGQVTMFVCCDKCRHGNLKAELVATINAKIAKAQIECPVMNKKLPKNPNSVIVEDQIIYICCKGCGSKIIEDPEFYLKKIDQLYRISLNYMY